jgi:hypothetical protein
LGKKVITLINGKNGKLMGMGKWVKKNCCFNIGILGTLGTEKIEMTRKNKNLRVVEKPIPTHPKIPKEGTIKRRKEKVAKQCELHASFKRRLNANYHVSNYR